MYIFRICNSLGAVYEAVFIRKKLNPVLFGFIRPYGPGNDEEYESAQAEAPEPRCRSPTHHELYFISSFKNL